MHPHVGEIAAHQSNILPHRGSELRPPKLNPIQEATLETKVVCDDVCTVEVLQVNILNCDGCAFGKEPISFS